MHDLGDGKATLSLTLDSGHRAVFILDPEEPVSVELSNEGTPGKTISRQKFPLDLLVIPTLAPLERNEPLVRLETVEKNRFTRLASRNFRNLWLHRSAEEFDQFRDLVRNAWPSIDLMPPEIERGERSYVRMFFRQGRNVMEVNWAGFGFQVWMQMMSQLCGRQLSSVVVIDEPDIYLHPDAQKVLWKMLEHVAFNRFHSLPPQRS